MLVYGNGEELTIIENDLNCCRNSSFEISACSKINFKVDSLIGECLGTGTMLPSLF